jgi:hypothetical protein
LLVFNDFRRGFMPPLKFYVSIACHSHQQRMETSLLKCR